MELTDREYARVLQYVEVQKEVRFPVARIASDVLLASFGWPDSIGKRKAKLAIETLERKGEIECELSGKTLKSIRVRVVVHEKPETPVLADKPKAVVVEDIQPHSFKNFKNRPKGRAKKLHEGYSRGDSNETFFHKSCERLVEIFTMKFSDKITNAECARSGRHRPEKGKIDLKDHHGEDESIRFVIIQRSGLSKGVFLIYNPKSSKKSVEKFNKRIRRFPGQEDADLKRAIWVNRKIHAERDKVEEVLNDIVGLSLIDQSFKDEVLRYA